MKICVITTIAQHYKGFDFHLRNLKWALKEYEYKIIVQTFKKFNLKTEDNNVELIEHDADPEKFFYFWNETYKVIEKELQKTDCFLFTEQDIFFIKKLKFNKDKIQINLHSDYLSIYDKQKQLLYPRIWEGCTVVHRNFLEKAIKDKIKFGNSKKIPNYLISQNIFTTNSALHLDFRNIENQISESNFLNKEYVDTLFEFTLYCFYKKFPFELNVKNKNNYEYGDQVVHFRALDGIVRANKKVYEDVSEIIKLKTEAWKRLGAGCAFVFFVIDIYKKTIELKNIISKNDLLKEKILMLKENSKEWMTQDEIKNLNWSLSLFEKNQKIFL
jgi:hypothetical protein